MTQRRQRTNVQVVNPDLLAYFIQKITKQYDGDIKKAAAKLQLSRHHLGRLSQGNAPAIRRSTYNNILAKLKGEDRKQFAFVFFNPVALAAVRAQNVWAKRSIEQIVTGIGREWQRSSRGIRKDRRTRAERLADRRRRIDEALAYLRKSGRQAYFVSQAKMRTHDGDRVRLGLYRIIVPLIEEPNSAFLERGLSDLSETERLRFIDAGIRRELILLERSLDMRWVQSIAPRKARDTRKPISRSHGRHVRHGGQ